MVARLALILLVLLTLVGCRPASPTPTAGPVTETSSPSGTAVTTATKVVTGPGLTIKQVKNAEYQLGVPDVPRMVQLVDGAYQEGAPGDANFMEAHLTDYIALGDIDGDGVNEAAALVSENYGGTGVFVFLALYAEQNDKPVFQASVFVDDRPQINAVAIEKGEISLDVTVHGVDEQGNPEPMCCPTLRTLRHYSLVNDQLDTRSYATFTPDGKTRTIQIESPASGTEVSGSVQIQGTVAIAPFENNLTYSIKDGAGLELSRGALSVDAPNPGGPGSFHAAIPLGDIISNTVVFLEIQDISPANGSLLAMDSIQLVVK